MNPSDRAEVERLLRATEPHLVEMTAETLRRLWDQLDTDISGGAINESRRAVLRAVQATIVAIAWNQLHPVLPAAEHNAFPKGRWS